jgi:hypothetical protein
MYAFIVGYIADALCFPDRQLQCLGRFLAHVEEHKAKLTFDDLYDSLKIQIEPLTHRRILGALGNR